MIFDTRPLPAPPLGPPPPLARERGVYSYRDRMTGETVYYAITSSGALLNGELRRRLPDEWDAHILRSVATDLARQDPVSDARRRVAQVSGLRPSSPSAARAPRRCGQLAGSPP